MERFADIEELFENDSSDNLSERHQPLIPNLSRQFNLPDNDDKWSNMDENMISSARKQSQIKFHAVLESICERYNKPFDGDEIDINSLELVVDKGYLRRSSQQNLFGRGIDVELINMIENGPISHLSSSHCKRCEKILQEGELISYCQLCQKELQTKKDFFSTFFNSHEISTSSSGKSFKVPKISLLVHQISS
jgi:hypothetical protein